MQLSNVFKKNILLSVVRGYYRCSKQRKIKSSHFVGISLGTILIRQIGETYPKRTEYGNGWRDYETQCASQILMRFGNVCKSIIPYLWLYRLFAYIIMPKKSHKESRLLFVREAKKPIKKNSYVGINSLKNLNPCCDCFVKWISTSNFVCYGK